MSGGEIPQPLPLDKAVEDEVRGMLVDYFAPTYRERTQGYVDLLLATDHYASRYLYLRSINRQKAAGDRRAGLPLLSFGSSPFLHVARGATQICIAGIPIPYERYLGCRLV